jgi:hypothetical protein
VSTSVRVLCHPTSDSDFSSDVELHIAMDLPADCPPANLVSEIQARLQAKYPRASISVMPQDPDGTESWEIYRDGAPA